MSRYQSDADLHQDLAIARDFEPFPAAQMQALEAQVYDEATDGRHERFKSTQTFDSQIHRSQHGFG